MAKIPFDIKYRPEIEAGKYKVKVGENEARIVCWDYNGDNLIVCAKYPEGEQGLIYDMAGRHRTKLPECKPDLELHTDDPEELTEFEKAVEAIYESCGVKELSIKEKAAKLLGVAYYQFEEKRMKDGIATISKSSLEKMLKDRYEKGKSDGYSKGQEDAEKRYNEATAFRYPLTPVPPTAVFYPRCFWGAPCTNPQHDCINCPRQGATGPYSTDTNIK